jgi:hypothetical protein
VALVAPALSTHPSGPQRIQESQSNAPKVQGLYVSASVIVDPPIGF